MADVQKTIWLNDVAYPIVGEVQRRRSSAWPAEFRTGRIEAQDYTHTRKQMWGPLRGGMGKEDWEPGADDRFWTSTDMETALNVSSLGPLVTTMGEATAGKDFGVAPTKLIGFSDKVWAMGNDEIAYWDATASNWVTAEATAALANPTDAIVYYNIGPHTQEFQPDADTETSSVDGHCSETTDATWSTIIAASGDAANDTNDTVRVGFQATAVSGTWSWLDRPILLFDLLDVPPGATVTSTVLSLYGKIFENSFDATAAVVTTYNVYSSAPASNTALAAGDYDSLGSSAYSDTAITEAGWLEGSRFEWDFNATGKTAVTNAIAASPAILKLGIREVNYDVGATAPTWQSVMAVYADAYSADKGIVEGVDYRPRLTVRYTIGGSEWLCVASAASGGSQMTDSSKGDASTWRACAKEGGAKLDAVYLAKFDNRLCALKAANAGFSYSLANDILSDWTEMAGFPNLPLTFTDMFVGKNADGETSLYFLTPKGLYYLDVFTNFISDITDVQWEEDANSGKCGIYWMGDIYIAVNKGIYKISGRTITYIGPDQDDGLETLRQGVITDMIGVGPWLVIAVDNSDATTHFSSILKRYVTGNHWHTVYKSGTANKRIKALMWKNGVLRFGEDTNVKSLPFPATTDNVKLASGHTYATAGKFRLPRFDGGFQAIPKVAHKLWAITQDCATAGALNEKFDITYSTDDATAYTSLGSFSTSPKPTALVWPDATSDAIGLEFENIQFEVAATRGTTTTNSPKLKSLVLEYRVVPPVIYDWTMTVQAVKHGGKRGQDFIDALETAVVSKTLLKFYPTGNKGDTSYLVEVKSLPRAVGGTVYGQEGKYQLTVGQVVD